METLRKAIWSPPQPTADPNVSDDRESYGYIGGQGSPAPAETASPKSYSEQSPSLPASGLTEFKGVDSMTWEMPSDKPRELLAGRDSGLDVAGASQKQYVGVRVKMPVRELLKKMRLSKALDSSNSMETSVKADITGASRRTGRRRAYMEKRPKQNRQKTRAALRSMEELDILVEVLQNDLCESHCNLEPKVSTSYLPGTFPELQPPLWEAGGSPQPDRRRWEGSWDPLGFQPRDSGMVLHTNPTHGSNCRMTQQHPDPTQTLLSSCAEERHWPGGYVVLPPVGSFGEGKPVWHNTLGLVAAEPLDGDTTALQDSGEWLKPRAESCTGQDTSAMSFFQFQLHQEESWLSRITVDKLLTPDKNGNRLLHKAVLQGKRALSYALSWRFAQLHRIDEKNGAKQTALHIAVQKNHHLIASDLLSLGANANARDGLQKTALHLCAEKGYLRVLEVLRNYQEHGTHIEVNAIDSQGLTPLQRAVHVHTALLRSLENRDLIPEAQRFLTLCKDQIQSSINCLLQMGANPWVQGSGLLRDPNGMDLPYLQREDLDPPLLLLSDFFDSYLNGDFQESMDTFPKGTM